MEDGIFSKERLNFHKQLILKKVLSTSPATIKVKENYGFDIVASNADAGQKSSIKISNLLAKKIEEKTKIKIDVCTKKAAGQTLGDSFEDLCKTYLESTFLHLSHLRPGKWHIEKIGSRNSNLIGRFEQYSHLAKLEELAMKSSELRTFLGEGYTVAPDVIIARTPESDDDINIVPIVDNNSCKQSSLRQINNKEKTVILHASISCKFTMRSDRSQNSRTEALNLLRSRKGRAPHIVSITAEPTPSRIASLALGTGDIDCVYHFALYELKEVLAELQDDSALELLEIMIEGKRLKDISDLPLDLAV